MNSDKNELRQTKSTTFPFDYNVSIGGGNFYVKVELGTPGQSAYVVLDTGSDLTWIQCKPCAKCFKQVGPMFDPSKSSSYRTIPCLSSRCNMLTASRPQHQQGCKTEECTYTSLYLDGSYTRGLFVQDKLSFKSKGRKSKGIVEDYLFGCGQNNSMEATLVGIMGLSRAPISFIYQTAPLLGKYFSYCLPSDFDTNGYLTFGKPDDSHFKHIKFTPIPTTPQQSQFYDVVITGISVDGKKLPISNSVFTKTGAIVDSGTTITRLPKLAYAALRSAFRKAMAHYKLSKPFDNLDTCYDLSHEGKIEVPKVSFFFKGGAELDVHENGTILIIDETQTCLAFTSTEDEAILGNIAQQAVQVVFDVEGGRVGFGPGTCN